MHYVYFLITRGYRPYSQITDMNLPGCYLMEGWAMNVFGWGDLAWRIYEFFLTAVLAASGFIIGGRRRWMAGLYCALFFTLMHAAEGPCMAVERDEVMTVLLVAATACLFVALRRNLPILLFPCGLLSALATSMKPSALLTTAILLGCAWGVAHRNGQRARWYLLWGCAGVLTAAAIVIAFMLREHAFAAFFFILRDVLPSYVKEKNFGRRYLLRHLTPAPLLLLILLAAVAAYVRRERWTWERTVLLLASGAGLLTYWVQAKGYLYHRYTYTTFLLLWVGWELSDSEAFQRKLPRLLEAGGLLALFLVASPFYVQRIHAYPHDYLHPQDIGYAMEADLSRLGVDHLQHNVQCLDLVNGCLTALYHLRLIQSTGTTGDLLLFSPRQTPAVTFYRQWFWQQEQAHPPDVIVLGNEWYFDYLLPNGEKLATWPAYDRYLHENYVSVTRRTFGTGPVPPAYQILLRKGSAILQQERLHSLR